MADDVESEVLETEVEPVGGDVDRGVTDIGTGDKPSSVEVHVHNKL